ncbi:MAG: shikimate kinase [Vallitaleaceae bacterium]|nr:shikimate kinase [Vallitaleaceae bacterium]
MKKPEYNLLLIGFMGTGKTTVSKRLSELLEMKEVDTDQRIVNKEKSSIPEIFEKQGEAYFRDLETTTLMELEKEKGFIVSCGGGIVLREENLASMRKQGKIILLTATPQTILERVKENNNRPLLQGNMNVEFIESLLNKRKERYFEAADLIIETDSSSIDEICQEIISKLS